MAFPGPNSIFILFESVFTKNFENVSSLVTQILVKISRLRYLGSKCTFCIYMRFLQKRFCKNSRNRLASLCFLISATVLQRGVTRNPCGVELINQNIPFLTPRCKTVAENRNHRLASSFFEFSKIRFCFSLDLAGELHQIPNAIFLHPLSLPLPRDFQNISSKQTAPRNSDTCQILKISLTKLKMCILP